MTLARSGLVAGLLLSLVTACPLPNYPCNTTADCDQAAGYQCATDGTCRQDATGGLDAGNVTNTPDAALRTDASVDPDAGALDAGQRPDARMPDAALPPDAAVDPGDAAVTAMDAALAADAAATQDAASPPDASAVDDAGELDAGPSDAAVSDAGVPDAAVPYCGDNLPLATSAWPDPLQLGRAVFAVDTSLFPMDEPVPVRLDLDPSVFPACALRETLLVLANGVPIPAEMDFLDVGTNTGALWVELAGANGTQLVDVYWSAAGSTLPAITPSPFVGYLAAWHMTGGVLGPQSNGNIFMDSAITAVTGVVGDALAFHGAQEAGANTISGLDSLEQLTLSAWVNLPMVPTNGFAGLVHLRKGDENDYSGDGVTMHLDDGLLEMEGREFTDATNINAPSPLTANTWTHVALTVNSGRSINLFINGAPVDPGFMDLSLNNGSISPTTVGIGHRCFGGQRDFLDGRMDEVRVQTVHRSNAWVMAEYVGATGMVVTHVATERQP